MDSLRTEKSHARVGSLCAGLSAYNKPTSSTVTMGMIEVYTTFDSNVFVNYMYQVVDKPFTFQVCLYSPSFTYTVEPVHNGPVLSGHPLLNSQFSKSRFFTCIRRPPLLSGRGHPVAVLCLSFFVIIFFICIKRPPFSGN